MAIQDLFLSWLKILDIRENNVCNLCFETHLQVLVNLWVNLLPLAFQFARYLAFNELAIMFMIFGLRIVKFLSLCDFVSGVVFVHKLLELDEPLMNILVLKRGVYVCEVSYLAFVRNLVVVLQWLQRLKFLFGLLRVWLINIIIYSFQWN